MPSFAERLIDWQHSHGRRDLPWQQSSDPYRVWLAEIMLQQTQVATVIGYYTRFLERFRNLDELAAAPVGDVMALWSGLGYYARARNLHAAARAVMLQHGGQFPRDPAALARLPGIGRSTANAIAVFCFGARLPILDGNVKRLLCRYLGIAGLPGTSSVESRLWQDAAALLPTRQAATYIQAQMDMGATVCTRRQPRCAACPVADRCVARRENRVTELPTPRPKKTLPERAVTLLVLRAENCVLLETRPPAGIWGGLLSLPELPEGAEATDHCAQHLGVRIDAVLPAPTFTQNFTHFRLHIRPLFCVAATQP
ncbi:MAG: A/G-specific adenine glycosylase, partial [Rhodocyclaceae bacterium]|nr:A/G-specific adenine glycosylase [Rhodocyclaceae bacterium]